MAPSCVECNDPGIEGPNEEGLFVCTCCGLVQPGGPVFCTQTFQPAYVCPGPAKILRSRSLSSKEKWVAKLRQYAQLACLNDSISKRAVNIYCAAVEAPDWKTRKSDYQLGVLVACLYHACNSFNAHRSPHELCAGLDVDPKSARRMVKVTQKAADEIQRNENCQRRLKCKSDVTHEMIPRCACRIAGVTRDKVGVVVKKAKEIYSRVRDTIDNHRPDTIAAGLLSVAVEECGIPFSNDAISDACLVAPNTVRSMAARIHEALA
jgi:transcription initiation factor TFIIIB Brf1 subunit/transcription initiation factor TFIIB